MPSDSLQATEELAARGATAPRVKLADIRAAIAATYYVSGDALRPENTQAPAGVEMGILTLCTLILRNGFIVVGKSAPASPENYDRAKGEQFAREDAERQLWPLMGFALCDKLAGAGP